MSKRSRRRNRQHKKSREIIQVPAVQPGTLEEVTPSTSSISMDKFLKSARSSHRYCMTNSVPPYEKDTRLLDEWVKNCLRHAPFLSGFIDQATMIHANRAYTLTGGRLTVNRFNDLLMNSAGGMGFRHLLKMVSRQYYESNFGGTVRTTRARPTEVDFDEQSSVYNFDIAPCTHIAPMIPTLFRPSTGYNSDAFLFPYSYNGEDIGKFDFFRVVSFPNWEPDTFEIGESPAYRCCKVMQITGSIYDHVQRTVRPDLTKGIIAVSGYDENAWDRSQKKLQLMGESGNNLMIFKEDGKIEMQYVVLSRMPDNLDLTEWLKWGLTECAIHLGLPLEEFIGSHASTLLGQSGSEVEAGERRASSKGGGEFIKLFEQRMRQLVVPETIDMEFMERDSGAELKDLEITRAKSDIILQWNNGTITAEEARRWGAEWGVIPDWMTEEEEEIVAGDLGQTRSFLGCHRLKRLREMAMEKDATHASVHSLPDEPIIHYENWYDEDRQTYRQRSVVLWEPGEFDKKTLWHVESSSNIAIRHSPVKRRQIEDVLDTNDFSDLKVLFTELFLEQYNSADLDTIIEDVIDNEIDFLSIDGVDEISNIVQENTSPLDESRAEELALILLLLSARGKSDIGLQSPNELTDSQSSDVDSQLSQIINQRVDSLFNGGGDGQPTILSPLLENSLNEQSYNDITNAIINTLKNSDNDESSQNIIESIDDILSEDVSNRSDLVSQSEASFAYGSGEEETAKITGAVSKTWIPSQNPPNRRRPEHVEQYGVTVGINETFPSGEERSNLVPFCLCNTQYNYE